jgi:hypothetical protein
VDGGLGLSEAATRIVDIAKRHAAFSTQGLSYAAKLAHLLDLEGGSVDIGNAPTLAAKLGWNIAETEARRAAELLVALEAHKLA